MSQESDRKNGRYNTISVSLSDQELARFQAWMEKQPDQTATRSSAARQLLLMMLAQIENGSVPDMAPAPIAVAEAQMSATLGLTFLMSHLLATLAGGGALKPKQLEALRTATLLSLENAKASDVVRNRGLWDEARRNVESLIAAATAK